MDISIFKSHVAQLVVQRAVNSKVVGSEPTVGAILKAGVAQLVER